MPFLPRPLSSAFRSTLAACLLLALAAGACAESNGGAESTAPPAGGTTATSSAAPAGGTTTTTTTTTSAPVTQDGHQAPPKGGASGFDMNFLLIMAVPLALMWFMATRSQKKEAKRQEDLRSGLKRGDKVVTIGGAHGEVAAVGESTIDLRVGSGDDAAIITFNKSAIGSVAGAPAAAEIGKSK